MHKIIWLTDFHLSTAGPVLGLDSQAACDKAIDWVVRHHGDADCCVVTGDLSENGTADEYRTIANALDRLPMPWLPLVGNHDSREHCAAIIDLPDTCLPGFVQYTVDLSAQAGAGVRLVCLDTLVPGESGGLLCQQRLAWLESVLSKSANRPVLVFMHHPPSALGVAPFDAIGLENASELNTLLSRYACVKQVFAGHVHRVFQGVVNGVPFATQRSVLMQAPPPRPAWNWDSFAPADEPPGYGVITVQAGDVTVSHEQIH